MATPRTERVTDTHWPYLRTPVVLPRELELKLDLGHCIDGLHHLHRDLEAMHDFVHEIYPAPAEAER